MKYIYSLLMPILLVAHLQAQNVGIGTLQPAAQLHIADSNLGDTARGAIIMSRYWLNSTDSRASSIYHRATTAVSRDELVMGVSGEGGSYSSPLLYSNAKLVIQGNGAVGIGTKTPVNRLTVAGNANFTGNVGIGTTIPASRLDVSGYIKSETLSLSSGAGQGKILTSDSIGNASWKSAPSGISGSRLISVLNTFGPGNHPTETLNFLGPTITLDIQFGQSIMLTATKALGTTYVGGANHLELGPGYLCSGCSIPAIAGFGMTELRAAQNTRQIYTVSDRLILYPGTYTLGMVGKSSDYLKWNNNEWGYLTLLIFE